MTVAQRKERDMGVMTLFGEATSEQSSFDDRPVIGSEEFDRRAKLSFEKEMLGLYISDHPLNGLTEALEAQTSDRISDLESVAEGAVVTLGGVITGLNKKWTRKGDLMAVLTLEDMTDSVEVMVFPRTFSDYGHLLEDDRIVTIKGRLDKRDDLPKLMSQTIAIVNADALSASKPFVIGLMTNQLTEQLLGDLKQIFARYKGESEVFLKVDKDLQVSLGPVFKVNDSAELAAEVRILLGEGAVVHAGVSS